MKEIANCLKIRSHYTITNKNNDSIFKVDIQHQALAK